MTTIADRMIKARRRVIRVKNVVIEERICELFNMVHFAGWALTLLVDPRILKFFPGFTAPSWVYALVFIALTISSIIGMLPIRVCRGIAAVTMSIGAATWFTMGIIFWQSYPPLSPWMLYYPFVALFTYAFAQAIEKECKKWGQDV